MASAVAEPSPSDGERPLRGVPSPPSESCALTVASFASITCYMRVARKVRHDGRRTQRMNIVVPLFLLAPLVLVPLGYRLLEVASPGSRPPAIVLRLVVPAAGLLVVAFWLPAGLVAAVLALPMGGRDRGHRRDRRTALAARPGPVPAGRPARDGSPRSRSWRSVRSSPSPIGSGSSRSGSRRRSSC